MTTLVASLTAIQERLDALARRHGVPGAVLAVSIGDELLDFATGVANRNTGVEATTDTLFQIGSNTKLLTTTLVMQLVDSGDVDLDAAVRRYVPSFDLAEPGAAGRITVRHLLTHTSGIQGDHFEGFGRGDDAIERYVDSLYTLDLVHQPGQMWSYCNSGFTLAGHLVERVAGVPFHEVLRERICEPLQMRRTTVLVEGMLAHRCAVGHIPGRDGLPRVPPVVTMEFSSAPAGSRTVSTAAELVAFVRMHLDGGRAADGTRVLSEDGVRAMQQVQAARPLGPGAPLSQGLGWLLAEWDGRRVIGHGGGTIGQLSFLQAVPEEDLVVALLTNSTAGATLWRDLARWLFETVAGIRVPDVPHPAEPPPDLPLERYAGTYERLGVRHRVVVDDGQLVVHTEYLGSMADLQPTPPPPMRLRPVDEVSFVTRMNGVDIVVSFLEFERGRPSYLFTGRAARRARTQSRPRKTGTAPSTTPAGGRRRGAGSRPRSRRG